MVPGGQVAETPGQDHQNNPGAVLRFSPVVAYSFLQVFSPAKVATMEASKVLWESRSLSPAGLRC
jgi:hypothetical protein